MTGAVFPIYCNAIGSQDSSVGMTTGYGLHGRGSTPRRDEIFCTPQRSDWFRGSASLLSNGYWELFPQT
jgi:hypothetical protein